MKFLNDIDTRTMDTLIEGLEDPAESNNSHRKIGTDGGAFMPLVVERIGARLFSLAHYYTQNGDRMRNPEVEIYRTDAGRYVPCTITQDGFCDFPRRESVNFDADGMIASYSPRGQSGVASFCRMWFRNLRNQQNIKPRPLTDAEREARKVRGIFRRTG